MSCFDPLQTFPDMCHLPLLERRWHENGQVLDEGSYRDGKKVGFWTTWKADGKVASEKRFKE